MIFLFTDYGSDDIYAGQVKGVLAEQAPGVPVIDLLHEAPAFNVQASASAAPSVSKVNSGRSKCNARVQHRMNL